ncbi:MAG: transcription elongation factor GreA [Candidatus Omnitrophica bacterium]|nr:transcription elongation factor GreA [Candidatus Omnitrophota bacterium]
MDNVYLTRDGYEKLRKELEHLKKTKRREIGRQLEYARSLGDLRENAEYDATKQAQALLEKRIAELEQTLSRVSILDDEKIDKNKVYLGALVKLKDLNSNEEISYILVNKEEADISQNKISTASPIGKALLGHKIGDLIEIDVPAGFLRYKIVHISRL